MQFSSEETAKNSIGISELLTNENSSPTNHYYTHIYDSTAVFVLNFIGKIKENAVVMKAFY